MAIALATSARRAYGPFSPTSDTTYEYVPPVEDGTPLVPAAPPPKRRRTLRTWWPVLIALGLLAVFLVVALEVPVRYQETPSLVLNARDDWTSCLCIPLQGTTTTNVSFVWTSGGTGYATLVAFPLSWGSPSKGTDYNVTASSGNGSFLSGPKNGGMEEFYVEGTPLTSLSIEVTFSYILSGTLLNSSPPIQGTR